MRYIIAERCLQTIYMKEFKKAIQLNNGIDSILLLTERKI